MGVDLVMAIHLSPIALPVVKQRIVKELEYQSSMELADETFEMVGSSAHVRLGPLCS